MKWVANQLSVVPIDPDTQLMKAMKAGAIGLKHGKVLNIYPEGERAFDGELSHFKKGAAILATELDLPILPVAIDGVYKVWARESWMIRPAKVKVRFGKPFYPKEVLESGQLSVVGDQKSEIASEPPASAGGLTDEQKYEIVTAHLKSNTGDLDENAELSTDLDWSQIVREKAGKYSRSAADLRKPHSCSGDCLWHL